MVCLNGAVLVKVWLPPSLPHCYLALVCPVRCVIGCQTCVNLSERQGSPVAGTRILGFSFSRVRFWSLGAIVFIVFIREERSVFLEYLHLLKMVALRPGSALGARVALLFTFQRSHRQGWTHCIVKEIKSWRSHAQCSRWCHYIASYLWILLYLTLWIVQGM